MLREPEYYAKQASVLSTLINVLGYTVAGFMAIGATFGALNCMYSAIASRQVEIATLRAIGFGALPVVVSVMIEALVLALLGGAVGGALAYVYCDGVSLSTLNFNTFSQVAFDFRVTRELLVQGFVWALSIGLAGGLLPAVRAARLPVTEALRILDETLPARFGGTPGQYQLIEEENGRARVRLLVHSAVGPLDPALVRETFLVALASGSEAGMDPLLVTWLEAGLVEVERRPPMTETIGKILHLRTSGPR